MMKKFLLILDDIDEWARAFIKIKETEVAQVILDEH